MTTAITPNEAVSAEIRAEIARRNITKAQLAQLLGWGPMKLSRRINGETEWTVAEVHEIAQALEIPTVQLVWPRAVEITAE